MSTNIKCLFRHIFIDKKDLYFSLDKLSLLCYIIGVGAENILSVMKECSEFSDIIPFTRLPEFINFF